MGIVIEGEGGLLDHPVLLAALLLLLLLGWGVWRGGRGLNLLRQWQRQGVFHGLLAETEQPIAAMQVRVAGTGSAQGAGLLRLGSVLGARLASRPAEPGARTGRPGSVATTFPASGTRPGMWLLALTERRLALWYPALVRPRLEWAIPAEQFVGAEPAGRVRLLIPAVRLYFRDGSSIRLNTFGGHEFLERLRQAGWPVDGAHIQARVEA